jgi:hypothetical protein
MKTLLLATTILFSQAAFSAQHDFKCEAHYFFGDKKKETLIGAIKDNSKLSRIAYVIDDQTQFNLPALNKDKAEESETRFPYYNSYKVPDTKFEVLIPEKLDDLDRITVIIGNGKTFERLECDVSEN